MRRANYVWYDEGRSLQIELSLALVQQLSMSAFEAFKSLPHRGLEIGGFLLGSIRLENGRTVMSIDDFAEVASEHRSGPSWQLSPADLEVLDYTRASHPRAVGMYRTDTLGQHLALQEDDSVLFQRHFSQIGNVYLVIHPATRTAVFCLLEAGALTIVHEFPFHAADLAAPGDVVPAEPAMPEPSAASAPSSPRVRTWATRVVALALGGVLGALAWQWLGPPSAHIAATAAPARVAPAVTAISTDPAHVALQIKRDGRVLHLTWDQQAPALRTADHATLHILDGKHETNLNLTGGELTSGMLSYWAETPDVTFRLETFGAGHQTDDSVRAVGGADFTAAMASTPPTAAPKPPAQHSWKPAPAGASSEDQEADSATRSTPDAPRPSPFMPPPKPQAAPMEAIAAPAPAPSSPPVNAAPVPARAPEPRVDVFAEPVTGSRLSHVVHHIPLLRRIKKDQATVPPAPLREVKPSFSTAQSRALDAELPVDVHVYITDAGKVDFAELVDTRAAAHHRDLADAAVVAARRWSFRPAHVGSDNVASEAILHFRFKTEEPPPSQP